jgi:hypothetical protein
MGGFYISHNIAWHHADSRPCVGNRGDRILHRPHFWVFPSPKEQSLRTVLAQPYCDGHLLLGRLLAALGQVQLLGLREFEA